MAESAFLTPPEFTAELRRLHDAGDTAAMVQLAKQYMDSTMVLGFSDTDAELVDRLLRYAARLEAEPSARRAAEAGAERAA